MTPARGTRIAGRPLVWILAVVAAVVGVNVWRGPASLEIGIAEAGSGRILWAGQVSGTAAVVEVHYVHTVERTPVVEVFAAGTDGLRFVEMRFVSQGAGLPTEGYLREGGAFVLRRQDPPRALPLAVSAAAGHRLIAAGHSVDLVALAGDGARVLVTSRRAGVRLPWARPRLQRL
jgi:hypothetical protein